MPTVFVVYGRGTLGPNGTQSWCPVESEYMLAGLKEAGAVVLEEREFALLAHRDRRVHSVDKVINYCISAENVDLIFSAVVQQNRWTHVIDTKVKPDSTGAYAGCIERCKRHNVPNVIVTYDNPQHRQVLSSAGVRSVCMPQCVPSRRKRTQKTGGILLSGTFIPHVYPVRERLKVLFEGQLPHVTHSIARTAYPTHPTGQDPKTLVRPTGSAYYDILDGYQFAVTCKMGACNIAVAKYVEFGMCHVLPIGDCPSYMPQVMKDNMLNVEGMTDQQIVAEVNRLVATPQELNHRQEAYSECVHQTYDLRTNAHRVMQEILST